VHVRKVEGAGPGEPTVRLVEEHGEPVAEVDGFLRLLTVREYSPNTVRAYAHDLQKLFAFLGGRVHACAGDGVLAVAAAGVLVASGSAA